MGFFSLREARSERPTRVSHGPRHRTHLPKLPLPGAGVLIGAGLEWLLVFWWVSLVLWVWGLRFLRGFLGLGFGVSYGFSVKVVHCFFWGGTLFGMIVRMIWNPFADRIADPSEGKSFWKSKESISVDCGSIQ